MESLTQHLQEAVRARQRAHLEHIRAEGSKKQETVRGFHPGQNHVQSHEFRKPAVVLDVATIRYSGRQRGALDHEGSARVVGQQSEALAADLRTQGFVEYPCSLHRVKRPHSWTQTLVDGPRGVFEVEKDAEGQVVEEALSTVLAQTICKVKLPANDPAG